MTDTLRDLIRGAVLNTTAVKSKIVTFFGQDIEVRQPTLGAVLDATNAADRKDQVVNMLLTYCYVPGTDETVFEEGDRESLINLPFGDDVGRMQKAIAELTTIDVAGALGNSDATP